MEASHRKMWDIQAQTQTGIAKNKYQNSRSIFRGRPIDGVTLNVAEEFNEFKV